MNNEFTGMNISQLMYQADLFEKHNQVVTD